MLRAGSTGRNRPARRSAERLRVRSFAIHAESFQFAVGEDQQRAAAGFRRRRRLHACNRFSSRSMRPAPFATAWRPVVEQGDGTEAFTVYTHRRTGLEFDFHFCRRIRRHPGGTIHCPGFVGSVGGSSSTPPSWLRVPDVAVAAIDVGLRLLRDVVGAGVGDSIFARLDVPFAPRSNDLDSRGDGFVAQFKAHWSGCLAGAAVAEGVGARAILLALGQLNRRKRCPASICVRTRRRRVGQVYSVMNSSRRSSIVAFEAPVAMALRCAACGYFLLADVANHGDDAAAIGFRNHGIMIDVSRPPE